MIASAKDYAPLAQTLLDHGADPNQQDIYGWTPLIRAAHEGHDDTLRVLLGSEQTELSTRDESGQTALHHAAVGGHATAVDALLRAGAKADVQNAAGRTPRELAARNGHTSLVEMLTRRRAGVP